jgi:hypothetical protein
MPAAKASVAGDHLSRKSLVRAAWAAGSGIDRPTATRLGDRPQAGVLGPMLHRSG